MWGAALGGSLRYVTEESIIFQVGRHGSGCHRERTGSPVVGFCDTEPR